MLVLHNIFLDDYTRNNLIICKIKDAKLKYMLVKNGHQINIKYSVFTL